MVLLYPNGRPVERRQPTLPTIHRLVTTVVSQIPNELYPFDPAVVRAIQREFDPDFIPVWVKNVFRVGTGGYVVQQYHAAAAAADASALNVVREPEAWTQRSLPPVYGERKRPTRLHLHFFNRGPGGRPVQGTFVPFGWNIYWFLTSMRDTMDAQEKKAFLEKHDPAVAQAKAVREADEAVAYKEKQDAGYLARNLEAFDVSDWKRLAAKGLDYNPSPATRPQVYLKEKTA